LRKTRYAVKQPELYPVIQYLESFVPRKELRELRREADEGEYSDWEYKEARAQLLGRKDKAGDLLQRLRQEALMEGS